MWCSRVLALAILSAGAPAQSADPSAPADDPVPSAQGPAAAEAPAENEAGGVLPVPDYSGALADRPALTGDWGGLRQRWADKGVTLRLDWLQAAQGIVDGGRETGWDYGMNLDLYVNLDLDRMEVIPGGLVKLRTQSRFGSSVNGETGLLLPVNTFANFPLTDPLDDDVPIAITELNYTQFFSESFGLLLGKITTLGGSNEFAGGEGRTQFMNFQFLFPSVYAQVAPYSTLAGGALWRPSESFHFTSILMNSADASTTSGFGDIGEGTTWWNSIELQYSLGGLPGGSTIGLLYGFDGNFARIGGINYQPGQGIGLATESSAWAAQWNGWQYLHTERGASGQVDPTDGRQDLQGLGLFASFGVGDENTNPVSWSGSLGLGSRGLFPGRDDDTLGLGYFYNSLQEPRPILTNALASSTQGAELYYNAAILGSMELTPNLQWVQSALRGVDDSVLLGVRLKVSF